MDKRIDIGDKLDLEKIDERISSAERGKVMYTSQVLDESDGEGIMVAMPIQEGKVIPLSIGDEYYAIFYTKAGLLRCRVEVTNRSRQGALFLLELMPSSKLIKVQRREYFRYECRIPVKYRVVEQEERLMLEEGVAYDTDDIVETWKDAVTLDISGGGIRFVAPFREQIDSLIEVSLQLEIDEEPCKVRVFALLLRCEQNPSNPVLFDNRIMFWKMPTIKREKVIRFIFESQRKNRAKELGMF